MIIQYYCICRSPAVGGGGDSDGIVMADDEDDVDPNSNNNHDKVLHILLGKRIIISIEG